MHLPPQLPFDILSRRIEIGVIQVVSDHDEVDVALRRIGSLRDGAVHEGTLDRVGVWRERFLDRFGQADGFLDESPQLFENWRRLVRSVVLLVADAFDRYEAASLQLRQFALNGTHSRVDFSHDLRNIEAALRVTENEREDALLHLREQRVGQTQGSRYRTHIGEYSAQIGDAQLIDR